jgi:hypothetical protein
MSEYEGKDLKPQKEIRRGYDGVKGKIVSPQSAKSPKLLFDSRFQFPKRFPVKSSA